MIIGVKTTLGSYDITLERGALKKCGEIFNLNRKVLIVTDSGVPTEYSKTVYAQALNPVIFTFEQGEKSKNIKNFEKLLEVMLENEFTRGDCVVAVGGGVVGDISGFAASAYMRGIDFYNIPTTLLSQVDSSIGGKTAVDFLGYKNIIGAFWQPKAVLIDPDTLNTLPDRQISNGLAESLKMAMTSDAYLFKIFEEGKQKELIDTVIERSLKVKRAVVTEDEKETGLRKILNFGHTLAHSFESEDKFGSLYHGECVALGMIPMCSDEVRSRLLPILKNLNLPTKFNVKIENILESIKHDKKRTRDKITAIFVEEIGKFQMKDISIDSFEEIIKRADII